MPDGNVIKTAKGKFFGLAPKDVISIGQPGSGGGGGTNNHTINGKLILEGDGFQKDMLKDPIFVREMVKIITKTMINQGR